VLFHGQDFDEARVYCETLAFEKDMRYVHSGNEPLLIAGVGTIALRFSKTRRRLGQFSSRGWRQRRRRCLRGRQNN